MQENNSVICCAHLLFLPIQLPSLHLLGIVPHFLWGIHLIWFNLDLSTVTQAFLKNSGELEATSSFLESGQRADGYPIWSRQDDLDLQKDDEDARDALVKKFGAQNVARRIEFRKK